MFNDQLYQKIRSNLMINIWMEQVEKLSKIYDGRAPAKNSRERRVPEHGKTT